MKAKELLGAIRTLRKGWFVAQEDTDLYNVFNRADFDEDGYLHGYNGQDGYHEDDFDVVFESNRFDDCERWIDNKLNE